MSPSFKFLIAVVVGVILAVLSVGYANSAPMRGNPVACNDFAKFTLAVVEVRNNEVPWELVEPQVVEIMKVLRTNPLGYIQTDADEKFILDQLKALWAVNDVQAFPAAAKIYGECMSIAAKRVML